MGVSGPVQDFTGIALPCFVEGSQNGDGNDDDEIKKSVVEKCISMQEFPCKNRILILCVIRTNQIHSLS